MNPTSRNITGLMPNLLSQRKKLFLANGVAPH